MYHQYKLVHTHVDTAKHVIRNLTTIHQILLEQRLVTMRIDIVFKKRAEVQKVFLATQTPLEDSIICQIFDQWLLYCHRSTLVKPVSFMLGTQNRRCCTKSPDRNIVMGYMVMKIDLSQVSDY